MFNDSLLADAELHCAKQEVIYRDLGLWDVADAFHEANLNILREQEDRGTCMEVEHLLEDFGRRAFAEMSR